MKDIHLFFLKGENDMQFKKYFIIANMREQFENESKISPRPYSDHPSQQSIYFVIEELETAGFEAQFFGGVESLIDACNRHASFPQTLFLNFSDGLNQVSRKAQSAILLELLNVPYAGSDPLARLMAGNKAYAKKIVSSCLEVPQSLTVFNCSSHLTDINFPVIIKPNREGSSLGISQESICTNAEELRERLPNLITRFHEVLIEEYIPGYEVTCFVIGNKGHYYFTEPIICEYNGIRYFDNFVFGLEEKANRKRTEYLAQKILTSQQITAIRIAAQTAFEMLNMHDFARVDFRLQESGRLFFIEINGNAVISETSEVGIISRELGIPFGEIVGNIIRAATERLNFSHD